MSVFHHFARHHIRLCIAIAVGVGVGFALPKELNLVARLLSGWNITVWCYLILMGWLMIHAGHSRVRAIAEQEDQSGVVVLGIM